MSLIIDVISRKTSVKQTLINPGDVTVVIYELCGAGSCSGICRCALCS